MKRRVVITGMGTINPLADNLDDYYKNLIAGKSGIKKWTSIDLSNVECKIGGDLGDYDCDGNLKRFQALLGEEKYKQVRKLFRGTTFSARMTSLCTLDAYRGSGLFEVPPDPHRTSIIVAGHNLNSNYIFNNAKQYFDEPEYLDSHCGVEAIDPNIPAIVSEILDIYGPTFTVGGACASGNLALRLGCRDILLDECDISIVAGPPFDVSPADIHSSVIINAVVIKPEYQDIPEKASRPFDGDRCGFLYSHGCATLIIEELEHARRRGAPIYAEVIGVKASANGCHLPLPGAIEQERVMRELIAAAGIAPEEVDYVNCHATGTPRGDLQEIRAVKGAFGKHAYNLKLNAPKSMMGHTCWASPLVETIGGILQMRHGVLHPTTNIDNPDPEIDLDICANRAVEYPVRYMLKNSFGFGGLNCSSLIKKYEDNE